MNSTFTLRLAAFLVVLCCFLNDASASAGVRGRSTGEDESMNANRGRVLSDSRSSDDVGRAIPSPQRAVVVPAPAPAPRTNDVVEAMIRTGGFQTLIKLLFTAGLVDNLKTTGPFTVFAPSNRALPSGQALADFVVSEPLSDLRAVLSYHVVPGMIRSTDLVEGAVLTTLQGQQLIVSLANGAMVNNARITRADIPADNGIIHTIDNMLMVF